MQKLNRIPFIASLALLVYMPFHVFLSQSLSLLTGGLDAWKIGKDIILALLVLFTICLVFKQGKANRAFNLLVIFTVLYGLLHVVLWAIHPDIYKRSAELGVIYNMRLPLSLVLGYGAVLVYPKFTFSSVIKVILITSTAVATLGIIQYFLPGDILSHLGYSVARGVRPNFYIDDNHNLPLRIMSTLREPNALGAYLVLPATALGVLVLRVKDANKRLMILGALGLQLLAIFLTLSRSALLGVIMSLTLVAWWQYQSWVNGLIKRFWPALAALVLLLGFSAYGMRHTPFFQHYIIHAHSQSKPSDLDSNQYHTLFVKRGLEGIKDQPLGHGPGTAGLASIQNPKGSFLTENYYVQIGYEIGVAGLLLFVALNAWLYRELWRRKDVWAAVLMASFWAYVLTNMLLHTWENEAVAAQWWILTGLVLARTKEKTTLL